MSKYPLRVTRKSPLWVFKKRKVILGIPEKVLKRIDFKLNNYDNCVANKHINGSQCTIS